MAILLKELTIRYHPDRGDFSSLMRDYFAMFTIWKRDGSGGSHLTPTNQRKTELVDDVFEQVARKLEKAIIENLPDRDNLQKSKTQMSHALNTKNWLDFHAAISELIGTYYGGGWIKDLKKIELNPELSVDKVSKIIRNFVKGPNSPMPTVTKKDEPAAPAVSDAPKWKDLANQPLTAPPAAIQRDLPMAGGQGDLPLQPREKLPPMPDNLPPMPQSFTGNEPKRLGGNWEQSLAGFGYNWSEADNAYKNDVRGIKLQVQPNNSIRVSLPSGKTSTYPNLGLVLRRMVHNRNRRHARRDGEPQAQVTQENYKMLYEFLYQ